MKNWGKLPDNLLQLIRIGTAISCLFMLAYLMMLCLNTMILVTYYKFGNRLSEREKEQVTDQLRLSMRIKVSEPIIDED